MSIADEEVGIQCCQINVDMSDPVGTIDKGEDAFLFANCSEVFEGHSQARKGRNSIEYSNPWVLSDLAGVIDCSSEQIQKIRIFHWIFHNDLAWVDNIVVCFTHIFHCLQASTVNMPEVENLIFAVGIPNDVSKNSIEARCCIRNKYNCRGGAIQEFSNCLTGLVQELMICVPDKWIWCRFAKVLIFTLLLSDLSRKCSK